MPLFGELTGADVLDYLAKLIADCVHVQKLEGSDLLPILACAGMQGELAPQSLVAGRCVDLAQFAGGDHFVTLLRGKFEQAYDTMRCVRHVSLSYSPAACLWSASLPKPWNSPPIRSPRSAATPGRPLSITAITCGALSTIRWGPSTSVSCGRTSRLCGSCCHG